VRRFLPLILLALVAAACADDDGATPTSSDVTSVTTAKSGGFSGSLSDEIDLLVEATEDVRGLEFLEPPNVIIVSPDELADRVRQLIEEDLDPDDLVVQQALFELLGLLDGSVDLGQAYEDLYAEGVGGFYDDDTDELVIGDTGGLSSLTKTIIVHELVHALTDQHYLFADRSEALRDADRFHEASALQALVEGDATYYQIAYMQTLPTDEQVAAVQESLAADSTVLDSLPPWFAEDLTFPYDTGFGFVDRLVADGGAAAVNQAYELVPATVEQVMHPEAYFSLEPGRPVTIAATTVEGYATYEDGEFGEWNLQLYLLDGVDPGEAVVGAAGWGGDQYRIMWDGENIAFVYFFEGDTPRDAEELTGSLITGIGARMSAGRASTSGDETTFRGEDYAFVRLDGSRVLLVAADDPVVGASIVGSLPASE